MRLYPTIVVHVQPTTRNRNIQSSFKMQIRDPNNTQAWLVGSGISSLAAALHLIKNAKVPGPSIHIIDTHQGSGGGMRMQGDEESGYFLPFECTPHFHGDCVEKLLSLIPSVNNPGKTILETVHGRDVERRSTGQQNLEEHHEASHHFPASILDTLFTSGAKGHAPLARFVTAGASGPEVSHHAGVHLGLNQRMVLIGFMLEHESAIASKSVKDIFDAGFFETEFWMLWSTTFGLKPGHSAIEFQRHLRKYLGDLRSLNRIREAQRTDYNLVESVIEPLTAFLKAQGVDFRFHQQVTDLKAYPEGGPTTVSQIEVVTEAGAHELITLDPVDILIVSLGSTGSGAALGSDSTPPDGLTANWEDVMDGDWVLWEKLAQKSTKFGNPMNFLPRILEATIETFTTTFKGPEFNALYERTTRDNLGTGGFLSLSNSNWGVTISVPHQPVFSTQSDNATVMLGYALNPAAEGNFVKKEMWRCTGQEILKEVLAHLSCAEDSNEGASILAAATTIPCGLPLGTAPFLTRGSGDRPPVIPKWTTNIACVGQFVEIPGDTTLEIDYRVHTAQIAVADLMGLPIPPVKQAKNLLLEVLNVLL
ncbi:streptococcal 67 kDa myosin-cross-reactive antigen like family-domain-containing protein [Aspergillus pseudodeflectus]|uniref:Streptococcal 67 kDa myosin-cross-reactive antigen like family-domain-containing protein n=1 Tax=Aspergillus pseudodeflectus TaxID=176178 RepID=A0ABR4L426_9EURO